MKMINMKSLGNESDKSDSTALLGKSLDNPKHFFRIMSTCIDSRFVWLVMCMGIVFYCITQEHHTASVYLIRQTKADSDIPLYSTDTYKHSNISITSDSNSSQIHIETETFWSRITRRRKRLSENSTNVERVRYLCFKTDQNLRYCVNLTEDSNENIILSMKIIINTKNRDFGDNHTNTVDSGSNTNTSNDPVFIAGLTKPMSVETFYNEEPSFESKEETNKNETTDASKNDTRTSDTSMLELRKTSAAQLGYSVDIGNDSKSTETKEDPNTQHNKDHYGMNRDRDQEKNPVAQRVIIVNEPKLIYTDQKKFPPQARHPVYEISNRESRLDKRYGGHERFSKRIGSERTDEKITPQYNKNEESESMKQYKNSIKDENYQRKNKPEETVQHKYYDENMQHTKHTTKKDGQENNVSRDRENHKFTLVKPRYFDQADEDMERVWTGVQHREPFKPDHRETSVKCIPRNQKDILYNTNSVRNGNLQINSRKGNAREMEVHDKESKKEIENVMKHLNKYDRPNKGHAVENNPLDVEELYERDQILAFLKNGNKKRVLMQDNKFKDNEGETNLEEFDTQEDIMNDPKGKGADINNNRRYHSNKHEHEEPYTLQDIMNSPIEQGADINSRRYHSNKHEYEEPDTLQDTMNGPEQQEADINNRRYHSKKYEYEEPDTLQDTINGQKEQGADINDRRYHSNKHEYEEPDTLQDTINGPKEQEADINNMRYHSKKHEYEEPDTLKDNMNGPKEEGEDIKNTSYKNKHKYEPNTYHEDPINFSTPELNETIQRDYKTKHVNSQGPKTKNQKLDPKKEALIKRIVEEFKNNFVAKFTQKHQPQVKPPQINQPPQVGRTTERVDKELYNEEFEATGNMKTIHDSQKVKLGFKEPEIKADNQYDEIPAEQINKQSEDNIDGEYDETIPDVANNGARFDETPTIGDAEYGENQSNGGDKDEEGLPIDVSTEENTEEKEANRYKGRLIEHNMKLPPGEYVNLNQGYFQKSPKSWESFDSVYHIRDNK